MMRTASSLQTHSRTRHVLWFVMAALIGLQSLGAIHRQMHAGSSARENAANAQLASSLFAAHTRASEATDDESLGNLSASCQLFDLAASGIALTLTQPILLIAGVSSVAVHTLSTDWIAALFSAYDARGPPALI